MNNGTRKTLVCVGQYVMSVDFSCVWKGLKIVLEGDFRCLGVFFFFLHDNGGDVLLVIGSLLKYRFTDLFPLYPVAPAMLDWWSADGCVELRKHCRGAGGPTVTGVGIRNAVAAQLPDHSHLTAGSLLDRFKCAPARRVCKTLLCHSITC